ncbi:hypothetical protein PENTCL1PPCAC_179, partial [Pristionchus entomophagus]
MARTLLLLAVVVGAQCVLAENVNCANWKRNGFCDNGAYTQAMKMQYCPQSCAASAGGTATTTVATAKKENVNCPKWNTNVTTVFCAAMTNDQKKTFCFTTCAKEIAAAAATTAVAGEECAFYVDKAGKVERVVVKKSTDKTTVKTGATTANKLLNVFASKGCTVEIYPDETTPATGTLTKAYPGDTGTGYNKINPATTA